MDAHTHAKITTGTYRDKFGIQLEEVEGVYARAARLPQFAPARHPDAHRFATDGGPSLSRLAVKKVLPLVGRLAARYGLEFFSIGGGLGIVYDPALASGSPAWWKSAPARRILTPARYAARLAPLLKPLGLKILVEPGRFIVGNAGILVTRVQYVKRTGRKNFVIVDAAMNDLIRPALYDSYHEIVPVAQRNGKLISSDVVGPICESADYLLQRPPVAQGWRRRLPGVAQRRGLWLCHGFQLQRPPPGGRGFGPRQPGRGRPPPPGHCRNLGRRKKSRAWLREK